MLFQRSVSRQTAKQPTFFSRPVFSRPALSSHILTKPRKGVEGNQTPLILTSGF
jgi:hypothetical protein